MASPNERKLRKLALIRKVEELNGTVAASTVVGAVVDVVDVVEDVVEDVVDVVQLDVDFGDWCLRLPSRRIKGYIAAAVCIGG